MTEEIIIDGVDVAGCEYYHKVDSICDNENNHNVGCGQYDTCTYKQLKRLEQENKDLKKQIESDKGLITIGGKQQYEYLQRIDELEQENRELSFAREKYLALEQERDELKKACEKCKLFDIEKTNRDLLERIDKLEQENKELEEENERLKEKIIKLTEENGNLIINRNTVENKLRDTESRLISIQKANTHNLVLLQRRNNALEEIREVASFHTTDADNEDVQNDMQVIMDKINEVLNS